MVLKDVPEIGLLVEGARRLGDSLDKLAQGDVSPHGPLGDIFRLNQEVGRMAEEFPALRPSLRSLQQEVNQVTVQIKRGNPDAAKAHLERVFSSIEGVIAAKTRLRDHDNLTTNL